MRSAQKATKHHLKIYRNGAKERKGIKKLWNKRFALAAHLATRSITKTENK
jgi:hypothetical protein